jgi:hypothetical protein
VKRRSDTVGALSRLESRFRRRASGALVGSQRLQLRLHHGSNCWRGVGKEDTLLGRGRLTDVLKHYTCLMWSRSEFESVLVGSFRPTGGFLWLLSHHGADCPENHERKSRDIWSKAEAATFKPISAFLAGEEDERPHCSQEHWWATSQEGSDRWRRWRFIFSECVYVSCFA